MTDATVEEATHTLAITVDDESEMVGYFDNVSRYRPFPGTQHNYSRLYGPTFNIPTRLVC